jgi:hypothetical protein
MRVIAMFLLRCDAPLGLGLVRCAKIDTLSTRLCRFVLTLAKDGGSARYVRSAPQGLVSAAKA